MYVGHFGWLDKLEENIFLHKLKWLTGVINLMTVGKFCDILEVESIAGRHKLVLSQSKSPKARIHTDP